MQTFIGLYEHYHICASVCVVYELKLAQIMNQQ